MAFEKRSARYLAGLDETVTVVKRMGAGHALRADGSPVGLVELSRLDREAWRARWRSLSPEVVSYMQTMPPSALVEVAILFDPLGDWSDYVKAQYAGGLEAAAARAELQWRVEEGAAELTSQLEQLGIAGAEAAQGTPFVFVSVPASMLPVVGQLEQATQVVGNGAAETIELSDDVVEPTKFHRADALPNYRGDGYKAAVIEPGTCRVRDTHFYIGSTVTHQVLGATCSISAQCEDPVCGNPAVPPACVNGRCVDGHGTGVTSVLTRFVPDAKIVYPNDGPAPGGPACTRAIVGAYDWLVGQDVRFVNESYNCNDAPGQLSTVDGRVQDYHARVNNILVTKSAGNGGALGSACTDSWNSLCVGSVDNESELSCFSSQQNPLANTSGALDREEPDVMAFGGQSRFYCSGDADSVPIAVSNSDFGTVNVSGTSYSAPSMLGVLMRAHAYCADQGLDLDSVGLRSLARTAGYSDNPDGWRYSTPKLGFDHADGGGVVYTDVLRRLCAPPGEQDGYEHGIVRGPIDPRSDGTNAPLPNAEPEYPDTPPQAMRQDQSLVPSSSLTGYRWLDLWSASPLSLRRGDRIRATFSWETCVATATGGAAPNDATDYDIFLFNHTTGRGLYASQSNDDVNEGFDVNVPEDADWEGDYGLLLIWPEGSIGCGGVDRTATTWMIQRAQ